MTFWSDLEDVYFQKLDSSRIGSVIETLRGRAKATSGSQASQLLEIDRTEGQHLPTSRFLDEFFSYYGFYQDVINELQNNCFYKGK